MKSLEMIDQELHLVIDGSLDALAVEIMRPRFNSLVQDQADVVLDLQQVNFIDSSGIGAIVFLFKRLRALDRNLRLQGVHGQPRELFQHLHIDQSINMI